MFDAEIYRERRRQLSQAMESGLLLFMGHDESPMNYRDNAYPFWQDASFLYYFGLDVPGLAVVIDLDDDRCVLFGPEPTVADIVWTGPQPTLADRGVASGIDDCRELDALNAYIEVGLRLGRSVHFLPPIREAAAVKIGRLLEIPMDDVAKCASRELVAAVVAQRSVKSAEEIAEMDHAVSLAADIHTLAMQLASPGMLEQEVVGAIEGLLGAKGSRVPYPIIFSIRGEFLHNHAHSNEMVQGSLALLDAGAESAEHYASDITRTFPIGGAFSDRQRQIYEIVLDAQESAVAAVRPGLRFDEIHQLASLKLTTGLVDLGLLQGDPADIVEAGAHALFFPHGLGHMIGLDVHDMESLGEDSVGYDSQTRRSEQFGRAYLRLAKQLEVGHVVTVEPGLYFIPQLIAQWSSEARHADFIAYDKLDDWLDFGGIRIEDNVVVTESGHRILGPPIPKRIDEVEALTVR